MTIYNVCAKLNTVHHKNKQKENFMSEKTSTAVLDEPLKDTHGSIDTLNNPEVTTVGMPENVKTIDDVEAQRDAEARLDPADRMAYLEEMITKDRNELARQGAKRGTRVRNRQKGDTAEFYESVHGSYNDKVKELGRLKLAESLENEDLSLDDKKKEVLGYLFEEQKKLRDLTTEKLEGTPMGKVVKWMNSGGRLKKFMKVAGVGLIAGAAGMATGGLAGGFIAAGVAGGSRMFRGFVAAEGKNGRALNDVDTEMLDAKAWKAGSAESLIDAGTVALGESYNDEIKGRQKKVRRAFGRGALYAGAGAIIGAAVHTASSGVANAKPLDSSNPNFGNHVPTGATEVPNVKVGEHMMLAQTEQINAFTYNPSENPFYAPNKLGIHDMGPPLNADPNLDGGRPAGFNDLTQHRWMDSPEQFASIACAMGIDNLPDDMASANGLAEHFKIAPGDMGSMHEKVMGIINDPTTHISTQNIVNPIASEYGVNMGNGNMDLAWDDYVNSGGTKTVIEFTDGNGVRRVLELRNECGGQRIVEMPTPPAPVYEQSPVYYEQSYDSQQATTTYNQTTYAYEQSNGGSGNGGSSGGSGGGGGGSNGGGNNGGGGGGEEEHLQPKTGDFHWTDANDGTQDIGEGTKPQVSAGQLTDVINVIQNQIGQNGHEESSSAATGSQTGIQLNGAGSGSESSIDTGGGTIGTSGAEADTSGGTGASESGSSDGSVGKPQ